MKQEQRLTAAIVASTLAALLAGCETGPLSGPMGSNSKTTPASTPTMPAPKPAPLSPTAVGNAREVPTALRTPLNQSLFLLVSGTGVQIYECAVKPAGGTGWSFKSPEATLVDATGTTVGKHYAGPTWESTDGSTVAGTVSASDAGPDASAVPWLLLTVKATTGSGVFTQTKSIQRLQTVGGVMPTTACSAGDVARVPYAATYAFFRVGT